MHLRPEVLHHGLVQRRPVTVVLAIHFLEIVGLAKLHETTGFSVAGGVASDQLQRASAQRRLSNTGKYSSEILLAQGKNGSEISISADPAFLDFPEHFRRTPQDRETLGGWRSERDSGHEPFQSSWSCQWTLLTWWAPGGAVRAKRILSDRAERAPRIVFPVELLESSRHGIRIVTAQRTFIWSGLCIVLWRLAPSSGFPAPFFRGERSACLQLAALHPAPKFDGVGFDEGLYRGYVNSLIAGGLTSYPEIVDHYIEVQQKLTGSILPPVRFLYIFSAYLWHQVFGTEALAALHDVASFFSILTLLLSTVFRLAFERSRVGLGRRCADELRADPDPHVATCARRRLLYFLGALLPLLALGKICAHRATGSASPPTLFGLCLPGLDERERVFVFVACGPILALNRWLAFGTVTRELLLCTVVGPLLGFVVLVFLAGGLETLRTTYQLSVSKNYQLAYAILTGDGPWHRYLVDLLLVSPVILLLALGAVFRLDRSQKPELFLFVFIAASYLVMCNIKYGMNLRYANMWDMPLRFLAFGQIVAFCARSRAIAPLILCGAVGLVCAVELRQYIILFVQFPLYELVPEGLLRALHILKSRRRGNEKTTRRDRGVPSAASRCRKSFP